MGTNFWEKIDIDNLLAQIFEAIASEKIPVRGTNAKVFNRKHAQSIALNLYSIDQGFKSDRRQFATAK